MTKMCKKKLYEWKTEELDNALKLTYIPGYGHLIVGIGKYVTRMRQNEIFK